MDETKLAALFEKLGAPDPRSWAHSQVEEGIPQLARFLFLREAWKKVLSPNSTEWIDAGLKQSEEQPGGGVGRALRKLLAAGACREDLTELVRVKQWELLFELCYLIDNPEIEEAEVSDLRWGLFEIRNGKPVAPVSGLHEFVLETDPTGREMRPQT